jgi:hypothetical protein
MVFALDRDTGDLLALSSPLEADAYCKRIDVKDGFWFFFDDDGSPLEARFEEVDQSKTRRLLRAPTPCSGRCPAGGFRSALPRSRR